MVAKKAVTKKAASSKTDTEKKEGTSGKELTVKSKNELAEIENGGLFDVATTDTSEEWGAGFDFDENAELFKNDFLIPKIWLAQKMSEYLNKEIVPGDFVNSLTLEKLAGPEEGVKFIVVKSFKRWQGFSLDEKGKKHYERDYSAIMTLKNANWLYEETIDGKKIVRSQVNSFIVLIEQDLIAGNPQAYCIDFTRSSRQGGRKLVTDLKNKTAKVFTINDKKVKLPSPAFVYQVTATEESFDDGDAWCKDIKYLSMSNKQSVEMAKEIYEFVKNNEDQIEFDDRDVIGDTQDSVEAEAHKVTDKVAGTSDI